MNDLKPCPFCGGVNHSLECDDKRLMCDTVECNGCGALVPFAEWNTRIADPEVARLTELLDDVCNYARRNPTSAPQCITDLVEALK